VKLRQIGINQTEITTIEGTVILFSYETPVAALLPSGTYVRTATKWSTTTSRHINKWLDGVNAGTVDQEVLEGLAR